jgi:glucose-1-phosphate cytidylyltransferase
VKAVILAGGKSTRMNAPGEQKRSKPLVSICGRPLISHVADQLVRGGATEIIVATGSDHGTLAEALAQMPGAPMRAHFTGDDTGTAGRLKRLQHCIGTNPFFVSYCDIVTDAYLPGLRAAHAAASLGVTIMATNPRLAYGLLEIEGDKIIGMVEKPYLEDLWVNGGCFVFDPSVLDMINDEASMIEDSLLCEVAALGRAHVWKHHGLWIPVDTEKDRVAAQVHLNRARG